jgi:hypothetical protein
MGPESSLVHPDSAIRHARFGSGLDPVQAFTTGLRALVNSVAAWTICPNVSRGYSPQYRPNQQIFRVNFRHNLRTESSC